MTDTFTPAPVDLTPEVLARWEELADDATKGPWKWWNLEGEEGDQGWSDNGPNLETAARGPVYSDGSQGSRETIISGWGHDAWAISIENADAHFIAAARTAVPALVAGVRERDEEIVTLREQRHDTLARVTELERDLDERFEHSDHQSAKYYQRMRKAEIREAAALAQVAAVEADRDAAVAEVVTRADKAEEILLGGIGQSWRKVIDDAILTLRGVDHG